MFMLSVYIEVGNSKGPITLSIQTVTAENRLFALKVRIYLYTYLLYMYVRLIFASFKNDFPKHFIN